MAAAAPTPPRTSSPAVNFDAAGAREAGYSDADIASYLGSQANFDVGAARKAGYDDDEIIEHLAPAPPQSAAAQGSEKLPDAQDGVGTVAFKSLIRGALESGRATVQAPTAFEDRNKEAPDTSNLGKILSTPVTQGWNSPTWWAAHIAHGLGESAPSLALGFAGAAAGGAATSETGPGAAVGALVGGAAGFGIGSAITEIAPAYQRAREAGLDHDQAVDRAMKEAGIAGAFGTVMGLAPGVSAFGKTAEGALKAPISEALAQVFAVQPTIGAAQQEAQGAVEGKAPSAGDLATGYAENVGMGAGFFGAHAAIEHATGGRLTPVERTPEDAAAPVLAANSVDDAIAAAQTVTNRAPIDIEAMSAQAQAAGAAAADPDDDLHALFEQLDAEEAHPLATAANQQSAAQEQPGGPGAVTLNRQSADIARLDPAGDTDRPLPQSDDENHRTGAIEVDNDPALQDVYAQAHAMGESLTDDEAHQILDNMEAHGIDPESAVAEHIERKGIRGAYLGDEGDHAAAAENEPVAGAASGADRQAGTVGERPEHVTGDASGTQPPGEPAAHNPEEDAGVGVNRTPFATVGEGLFGEGEPALFARRQNEEAAPPLFSALTRAVEGVKMGTATPGQWEATIKNMSGIKGEEVAWSGVNEWLRSQTKSVTKAEVLDQLRGNEVRVQEIEKQEPKHSLGEEAHLLYGTPAGQTKFGSYTLPGGKNYRELLLTLPEKESPSNGPKGWGDTAGGTYEPVNFRGAHFDEPNVLAHVRFDDRTGPNGEKILHMAEVQSDWHQQGRRFGYKSEGLPETDLARAVMHGDSWHVENGHGDALTRGSYESEDAARAVAEAQNSAAQEYQRTKGVPDAPFKTSWHELAMKRMLRYAAENGYDKLSWDKGDVQAARYDLSKKISRVEYTKSGTSGFTPLDQIESINQGQGMVRAFDHDGKKVIEKYFRDEKELPNIIGKDATDKLLQQSPRREERAGTAQSVRQISGLDLKVGGEGMKGFYDKILPSFLNKYAKKWGAKVEDSGLQLAERRPGENAVPSAAVHSIPITDAMRESVMRGQPLFQPRKGGVAGDNVHVRGIFTPEFDAARAGVAPALRARLDQLGLHEIALKLPDTIHAISEGNATAADGVYLRKTIALALDAKDLAGTLDHEAVHALRSMGLFTKSEWSMLSNRAVKEWRAAHNIDTRYGDLPEEKKNEEAIAEAFRAWVKDSDSQKGFFARVFDKVRNALDAIGSALRGRGFQTPDSIFRRIDQGEIGARPRAGFETAGPQFSRRDEDAEPPIIPPEERIYRDGVSNLIEAVTGSANGASITDRGLLKIATAGTELLKNLNPLEAAQTIFPRTLATLDSKSARLWNAWTARDDEGHANAQKLRQVISDSLVTLPAESRDRVYAAIELARKWDWRPPDDGRAIRVRNATYWQAQKSKVGDDYVLSKAETKAFHDTMRLGDEGWRTFMRALARREDWKGAIDPKAIIAAANDAKSTGLPEGKRLLRLAAALTMAQDALKHPYFSASRFGDYFIAVKAKIGADMSSTGGYPKVEWFETVEKPLLNDILGKKRTAAKDMQGVQDAITRIRAMKKPDGSPAFPEQTHDIETGDLRMRPDVLRKLNIPAIEKLFMLMERGTTSSLQSKIIADATPDDGLRGKDAAQLKQGAKKDVKARYQALLGETKDALLDAMHQDLLAGWKKQANFTPGYSSDFDRAIGTHIGQISKNAATMVHHNAIEDAYQDIQDNHPHQAVKDYWRHWRDYQESPRSPLSRAAANTAQLGAAYVMALNPSTTMMIAAHTPMMAVPVLSVGGRIGQAALHMWRATREAYGSASFDTKKGAFIDVSKLGTTPAEKAIIADLHNIGMLHSVGADDVRAINDRQAGLWGEAAPIMRRALDISMSNISVVDQANRSAIALAAFRMASNPATLEKMAAPWMEHNAVFREMVRDQGLTPENFTKFMMSEAAGAWGRTNQAPMMRGTEGSLLFALHGFQTRYLSTAYRLMRHMGPEGRVAAAWMMGALALGAGAYGLPLTQDAENAGDLLLKKINGVDPMIDAHIRQFLGDAGFGKIGADVMMRGPLSVALGVDLGSRLGFGDILTRMFGGPSDLMGTIPSILWGRLGAAWNREVTGQGNAAATVELLPAALRNPARAAIEAGQGQISQRGSMLLPAKQMTASHEALRAVGLPPLDTERAGGRSDYLYRLKGRDNDLRRQTETSAANLILQANQATRDGNHDLAHDLGERMSALITAYDREHWQAPITQEGLNDAILQMNNPEIYQKSRLPSRVRGEAQGSPYP